MVVQLAAGTRSSVVVEQCQVCGSDNLQRVLFLGFLPPVNTMQPIGTIPREQPSYPALLLHCERCRLVQLGLTVDPGILFPPEYAYTSGTTRILRENFANLGRETHAILGLQSTDLVIDIGSNDGTLLSNFVQNHRVLGIEPTNAGELAISRGIPTTTAFFNLETARRVRAEHGPAKLVTATNVFAHIEDVHSIVEAVKQLLDDDGVFISESHYLLDLLSGLQYDTVYHEHLRYYSLLSLRYLLEQHGLQVFHITRIPTHGGSIRVYAAPTGRYPIDDVVNRQLAEEEQRIYSGGLLVGFRERVVQSKLDLLGLLRDLKQGGRKVYAIGAPSRASTLVNYVGLDDGILDSVLEIKGSHKIGKYMPGTLIPVFEESKLFEDQPDYALLLSWHIADELMPKLTQAGFRGKFVVPLPTARVVGS
jgi:hypothetical protein